MTLSGKPALVSPRLSSLPPDSQRELKQRIDVIRERLGALDSAVNAITTTNTDAIEAEIQALRLQLNNLTIRVSILETELAGLGASARLITTHTATEDVPALTVVRENALGGVRPVNMTSSFNDDAQFAIGVALTGVGAGGTVQVVRAGVVSTPGAGWITDETVFAGENGELNNVPAGPVFIPVGYAISEDAIQVLPQGWATDVYHNGIFVGTRQRLNFVDGAAIVMQIDDDDVHDRVNIVMGTTAGGAVFPGAGSLTFNGHPPTVALLSQQVSPGAGSLVLDGQVPQILVSMFVAPGAGSLVLSGLAPAVFIPLSASPGAGSLVLSGLTPTVAGSANQLALPGAGALTLAGLAPSLVIDSGNRTAQPGVGALALTGLAPTIAIVSNTTVTPGAGSMTMTGLAPALSRFTFFRNFVDLSISGLTSYKGTVSAATGELVPTPTSGSVHQRVYFDLLPTGSPTDISGAFDITANFHSNAVTTAVSGVVFFANDDGTANTMQNTYWVDLFFGGGPAGLRFVKVLSGSASVPGSASYSSGSGTHALRVTGDGAGNFSVYLDGVHKFDVTDTAFTHGRFGLIFNGNPGPAPPLVDYGINYTP